MLLVCKTEFLRLFDWRSLTVGFIRVTVRYDLFFLSVFISCCASLSLDKVSSCLIMICSMKVSIFEFFREKRIGTEVFWCKSGLLFSRVLFRSEEILEFICIKLLLEFWLLFTIVFASINVSCYWCYRLSYCSIILPRLPCRWERIYLIFCFIDSSEMSSSVDPCSLVWYGFESLFPYFIISLTVILLSY